MQETKYITILSNKKEVALNVSALREKQKHIIDSFAEADIPKTDEVYHDYYRSFDYMPFAFMGRSGKSSTIARR